MSKFFSTILPSLLAGGLVFGSALSGAQTPPAPPAPPAAPAPGVPAVAPKPPKPPKPPKVSVHFDLGEINQLVDEQIRNALETVSDNENIPPNIRESVKQRLEKLRIKLKKRLANVNPNDMEHLGDELGKMGEEIGQEMDQFGKDMDKWGKDMDKWGKGFEKDMAKQMKSQHLVWKGPNVDVHVDTDGDDDHEDEDVPSVADFDDADDLGDAMKDLGTMKLAPSQRTQLKQLRTESDARVASAKKQLDLASDQLRQQLEVLNASNAEIERAIDNVTRAESEIRKARILAWVNARRMLDEGQRKKIEAAARKGH